MAALGGVMFYRQTLSVSTGAEYNQLRDLSNNYQATEEILAAKQLLQTKPGQAQLLTKGPGGTKSCALTFDGLGDSATMDGILDVLTKYSAKGTFFVEGSSAAAAPKTVTAIVQAGQKVGDYTYVGLAHLEKVPAEKVIAELCRTQKVLQITTDFKPACMKANGTVYTPQLLTLVKACGINYAVQSDKYVVADKINSPEDAHAFVKSLKPGQIISFRLTIPADLQPEKGKTNERPAIDKQPGLEQLPEVQKNRPVSEALDLLLQAMQESGYGTDYVENYAHVLQAQSSKSQLVTAWVREITSDLKQILSLPVACAATPEEVARDNRMVYTTARVVPFTFTGLKKENSVRHVLTALREAKGTGTFFVTEQEAKKQGALINEILADGNELGIAVYPRASEQYAAIAAGLERTHNLLAEKYGVNATLVKQFSGVLRDDTRAAIKDKGYTLVGHLVNVVQSKHQHAQTTGEVMKDIFGPRVFSVGRGWIMQIRMDWYDNPNLAGDMLLAIKRDKIDNIAYISYDDSPNNNPNNDSAYVIRPVGTVLADKAHLYRFPVPATEVLAAAKLQPVLPDPDTEKEFMKAFKQRYIGFKWVNEDDRMLGFSRNEAKEADKSGLIHTHDPVVFFTFDDWGTDVSINQLLYVLHKHRVQGNFFVLTHNVLNNPNLLRAMAQDGHDIGAHTNMHKAMAVRVKGKRGQQATLTPTEILADALECHRRMEEVVGDVEYQGQPVLTDYFRPPTLAISRKGMEEIYKAGYSYVVAGSTSTEDYSAPDLQQMINRITDAIYYRGKVRKGAVLVMHMSDTAKYTALALDAVLTANERRLPGDPAKFMVGRLSDYLVPGYDQSVPFRN